ncbi:hypothetical protein SAMN02745116_00162 [Pilibacter termitis]|uniref:SpaA-like prealbumin fold domain-containing protein n=1 Tax=Pilibacter termitis TaxID=263852 RepID=A0A1T4KAZ1_9ENTE|nr:SpaA isopeptide-forming pilin-related protein [Pilibacter termitis]SJZ39600.1 hypothetical protein SAMN02745116_00162 [Pilibacter termitis]
METRKIKEKVLVSFAFIGFISVVAFGLVAGANTLIPSDAVLDSTTDRVITISKIKGGSGSPDSQSLVGVTGDNDAINAILGNGWQVDNTGSPTTYRISKLKMNAANTAPAESPLNYTVIDFIDVTTSGGNAQLNLGSPTHHVPDVEAKGFYTLDYQGNAVAEGDEDTGTPDGYYLIEEQNATSGSRAYRGYLTMPNVQEIDDGTGHSKGQIIYDVHLFPKVVKEVSFGFSTAVNILNTDGTTMDRFADKDVWLHDTVANGDSNNWTILANYSKTTLQYMRASNGNAIYMGFDGVYSNKHSATKSTGDFTCSFTAPTAEGTTFPDNANISNNYPADWKGSVGLLITNLNDDTYEYISFGKVVYDAQGDSSSHVNTVTYNGVSWSFNGYNAHAWWGTNSAMVGIPASWGDATHLGVNNKLGDKYAGIDLTDPAQGYKVQVCATIRFTTLGYPFTPEYLSTGGSLADKPVHPYELGAYVVDTSGSPAITTFDTDATNGLPTGFPQAADGYKTQDNPNGVFLDRAYITTGSLNADKINSNGSDLTGAKFLLKVKDTHGANPAVEGQYISRGTGNGAITYTATKASGTALTSGAWLTNSGASANTLQGYFQMPGIDPDWDYELEETTAPDTYQLLSKPLLIPSANISTERFVTDETNGDYIKVVNIKKMILPVTGGIGLGLIVLVGLTFIFIGGLNKKRMKGSE